MRAGPEPPGASPRRPLRARGSRRRPSARRRRPRGERQSGEGAAKRRATSQVAGDRGRGGTAAGLLLLRLGLLLGPGRGGCSEPAKAKLPARLRPWPCPLALALARPWPCPGGGGGRAGPRPRAGVGGGGGSARGRSWEETFAPDPNSSAARSALGSRGPRAGLGPALKGAATLPGPAAHSAARGGGPSAGNWSPGASSPHSISPWLCPSRTHAELEGIVRGPESYPPGN